MRLKNKAKFGRYFFILTIFLSGLNVSAQNNSGVLNGAVTDENQAVIPEAKLVLTGEQGAVKKTTSDAEGRFSFGEMPFGKYVLTVEKEGFARIEREIVFNTESKTADLTLEAGSVSATVNIVLNRAEAAVESTLKLPVSIHETPRSVTVVGEERIQDQNFQQVSDLLTYVPGTTANSFRTGGYHFYARGYRQGPDDTRLDGVSGINVGGGFGANLFGIQEAVVLRGPAGLIYGQTGVPGGFINLISKKPQEDYFTQVELRGGGYKGNNVSFGERPSFGIDFDSTGKIFGSDRFLYRGLFTVENMNYFTKDVLDRNRYVNGSLAIKIDDEGRYVLTPSAQYTRHFRPFGGGIVISPTTSLRTNDNLREIKENDLSSPDVNLWSGRRIDETSWAGVDFRGVVTDKIRVNAGYRFTKFDTDLNQFAPQVSSAAQITELQTQNTVSRVQAKSITERDYHTFNADAAYEWLNTGWWRNTTQIGYYQRNFYSRATAQQGAATPQSRINIYTGVVQTPLQDTLTAVFSTPRTRDLVWNGFVQNRTSLDKGRWNFTLGFNYGQNDPATGAVRKSGVIPNASIVFNAAPELALFASYATSFNPADPNSENAQGVRGTFEPTIGKNYEIGAKYDLLDRRLSLALALFHNKLDNTLTLTDSNVVNQNGNRFFIPSGSRRSRGVEFSGEYQIRGDLRAFAGVSYLDAIYTGFPSGLTASGNLPLNSPIPGSRAEKSPRWSYNAYTRYDRREGYLKGFGAGLGLVYQGSRVGSNGAQTFAAPDPLVLPSYVKVDTAVFYRPNKYVNFAVNFDNIFDELIFVNATVGSNIEIAAPRSMTFRTTFNF